MPRIKEFNEEKALGQAMDLFWSKGYYDTSIDDLVKVTGVGRSGLYNTFGNKKSFFLKSLDHYCKTIMHEMLARLKSENAGLQDILDHFEMVRDVISSDQLVHGCFLCNTYVELGPHDGDISNKIVGFTDDQRKIYHQVLKNAKSKGEINKNLDIEAITDHLTNTMMGIAVLSKSPLAALMINNVIDIALAPLKSQ